MNEINIGEVFYVTAKRVSLEEAEEFLNGVSTRENLCNLRNLWIPPPFHLLR